MITKPIYLLVFICLGLLMACGTYNNAYYEDAAKDWSEKKHTNTSNLAYSLWLVGDAGDIDDWEKQSNYVLDAVTNDLTAEEKDSNGLVYLGDNLYSHGLAPSDDPERKMGEQILAAQCNVVKDSDATAYFIPGNHDWNRMSKGGLKRVKRQEDFVENFFQEKDKAKFYPSNGCADPKVVRVNKDLVLLFIDTQWWLQDWDKEKKMNKGCDIKTRLQFIDELKDIFSKYKNKQIVVLGHHPHYSNGHHNGGYSLKEHLFPLAELKSWLYLPLPILGSIYPIYRTVTGAKQDIPHASYQEMIEGIQSAASVAKHVIYASGHEHCLEYYNQHENHFIVSGSGSRVSFAKRGGDANFVYSARGYSKLDFYENGAVVLQMFSVDENANKEIVFEKQIVEPRAGSLKDEKKYPGSNELPDFVELPANAQFASSGFKKFWLGEQYRDMWAKPVKAPIIDLGNTFGGLTPIKKGGGMASNSLRMENPNGNHYILRSINKDYKKLLPENFKNLKAVNIMKDQNSASHPYGAVMLPSLSKAAGIYYTEPKLVYLKHQERLGNYNELFPEEMYLLEERPSGDWSHHEPFGNSAEIISYMDVIDILENKKNHFVDQKWVLKSRLFDIWIHDWDRHDDQWRWASFKDGDKTIYRPIPRDRDQAFYKFEGLIPRVIAAMLVKKFRTFDDKIPSVAQQSFNAKHFDRYFMNELEWEDWEEVANQMMSSISDEHIAQSVSALPSEVQDLYGTELQDKLIARKKEMLKYARELYEFINKGVDVVGTNNKELFDVSRNADGSTSIMMYTLSKEDKILKYSRTFEPKVTKEIRLYGLDGKDEFNIKGNSKKAIKLRIIGGEDKDKLIDESEISGGKTNLVYDMVDGMEIESQGEVLDLRENSLEVNEYNRSQFMYNTSLPWPTFGYTPDDGFWFGFGINGVKHGWRKDPYASIHNFSITLAPGSRNALKANYNAVFKNVIARSIDFAPTLFFSNPSYINYFGIGNLSMNSTDETFNWVRISESGIKPMLRKAWNSERSSITFGPALNSYSLKNVEGRILDDNPEFVEDDFDRKFYLGAELGYNFVSVDNNVYPSNGVRFSLGSEYQKLLSESEDVLSLKASTSFYFTLMARPRLVLATTAGYEKVYGDPQIYQFATLGNRSNLRGFRNERFRGDRSFYHQSDLRMHLFNWNNDILPMSVGLTGGYDYGRVWIEDEDFDGFHNSWSVGISMNVLDLAVVHPYYSSSVEANLFNLMLGFAF